MEEDLKNELLCVIANRRAYSFNDIKNVYDIVKSIEKCIKCLDEAMALGECPKHLAIKYL